MFSCAAKMPLQDLKRLQRYVTHHSPHPSNGKLRQREEHPKWCLVAISKYASSTLCEAVHFLQTEKGAYIE